MMGADALEQGIDVGVSSWTRLAPNTLPALAKGTANYANSALIKMQAMLDGYADAVALDESGLLSEGSGQNLFLVRDNVIYTPSLGSSVLQGITRETRASRSPATWASPCGKRPSRASSCTWPTKRSSAARLSRSPPFDPSTRSPSATASADRSPRRCKQRFFGILSGELPDTHHWLTPTSATASVGKPTLPRQHANFWGIDARQ